MLLHKPKDPSQGYEGQSGRLVGVSDILSSHVVPVKLLARHFYGQLTVLRPYFEVCRILSIWWDVMCLGAGYAGKYCSSPLRMHLRQVQ